MDDTEFSRRIRGRILTPDVVGLPELEADLRDGRQIVARRDRDRPVSAGTGPAGLLSCETSGSTGAPKVILRRAASWCASFAVNGRCHGIGPGDRYAALGSLAHSITLYAALEGLSLGADLALLSAMTPRRQARALADLDITVLYATPAQLRLLSLGARADRRAALPRLRLVMVGGGAFPAALRSELARLCPGAAIRHFYGTSETSFVTWTDRDTPEGSVGRPYPGVDLRLDESGAIRVRSPYLFEGYDGAAIPVRDDPDGFLATGEIGRRDEAGNLFLLGRADRMITVRDRSVFPERIEAEIARDPAVELCAVVTCQDLRRDQRIVCVVQGVESAGMVRRLRRRCRLEIGPEAVPHRFVFMDRLPILPAGKPDLARLARELIPAR